MKKLKIVIILKQALYKAKLIDSKLNDFSSLQVVGKFSNYIDAKLYIVKNSVDLIIIELGLRTKIALAF